MSDDCFGKLWTEDPRQCRQADGQLCNIYEQCGRVYKMGQANKRLQAVSPYQHQPPRPGYVVPVVSSSPMQQAPQPQKPAYTVPQQPLQRPTYASTYNQQPSQMYPAVYHPIQNLMPNEAASFLTVLEPQEEGAGRIWALLAEAGRAGLKGVLMQSTYLVDHVPFRQK